MSTTLLSATRSGHTSSASKACTFCLANTSSKSKTEVQKYESSYLVAGSSFAPVVKMTAVRTILALVTCADLEYEANGVVTAFLHGDLEEDIFMEVPDELKNQNLANMVCKLQNPFTA